MTDRGEGEMEETKRTVLAARIFEVLIAEGNTPEDAASVADSALTCSDKEVDNGWKLWKVICPRCGGAREIEVAHDEMSEPLPPIYEPCPLCKPLYHERVTEQEANFIPF